MLILSDISVSDDRVTMKYAVDSIIPSERWIKFKARIIGRLQPPILRKRDIEVRIDTDPFEKGILVKEYIAEYSFKRKTREKR